MSRDWACTATAFSLDNRDSLPPFMPVLRNEDGVYGEVIKVVFEHGYFGYVPWAILHAPNEKRAYGPSDVLKNASAPRFCELLVAVISSTDFWPGLGSPARRLRALGEHLTEVGSLRLQDFEEFVRIQLCRLGSHHAARLEKQLQTYGGAPAYWAESILGYLELWSEAVRREQYIAPRDLVETHGLEEARTMSRILIRDYGRLLCRWPDMVEAARRLREKGNRLGVPA